MEKRYNSAELPAKVRTRYNSLLWVAKHSNEKRHILSSGIRMINYSHIITIYDKLQNTFLLLLFIISKVILIKMCFQNETMWKAVSPGWGAYVALNMPFHNRLVTEWFFS